MSGFEPPTSWSRTATKVIAPFGIDVWHAAQTCQPCLPCPRLPPIGHELDTPAPATSEMGLQETGAATAFVSTTAHQRRACFPEKSIRKMAPNSRGLKRRPHRLLTLPHPFCCQRDACCLASVGRVRANRNLQWLAICWWRRGRPFWRRRRYFRGGDSTGKEIGFDHQRGALGDAVRAGKCFR